MRVKDFTFELPSSSIATSPVSPRDSARLLCIQGNDFSDKQVRDLPALLKAGDVLVFNNTKVIPARLYGKRGEAKVEILLHRERSDGRWKAFAKPARKFKAGDVFQVAEDFHAEVISRQDAEVELQFNQRGEAFYSCLERYGKVPLPPYIAREAIASDTHSYQTVYAEYKGAVAAPTAGLHFTEALLGRIKEKGVQTAFVTLHVGAGTFLPVKTELLEEHRMHAEYGVVTEEVCQVINAARRAGGRVVPVGTTSLRLLESAADDKGILHPFSGETDIFITPGYRFKMVDVLMTNFHLPESTLFMLVCALAGTERMKQAYAHAISSGYRFYSYGDACWIEIK